MVKTAANSDKILGRREKARVAAAAWRKANPDRVKAANVAWRKANPEKARECNRRKARRRLVANMTEEQRLKKCAESKRARDKKRAASPPMPRLPRPPRARDGENYQRDNQCIHRARHSDHPELVAIAAEKTLSVSDRAGRIRAFNCRLAKEKRDELRKTLKERRAAYKRERESSDPCFRLAGLLRTRLYCALKGQAKNGSAVRNCGIPISQLRTYLESLFEPGWTWENWGGAWEVDHIYPFAAADIVGNRAHFLAVNNWRNLRPLSYKENKNKNGSVTPEARALFDQLVSEFSAQLARAS